MRFVRGGLASGVGALAATILATGLQTGSAWAGNEDNTFVPTIWIDPDGCEHWVMDDGWEGYMDIHLDRNGRPVCRRSEACGAVETDQLFATNKAAISASGRRALQSFFQKAGAYGYVIVGHTDSRASDAYNMRLSERRARAVAEVALGVGARAVNVYGMGEREPKASNATAEGMRQNRRVEIFCLR